MGKSRLAPLKPVIIPGMELSAAVLSTRLDTMFREELEFTVDESIYWTDSTCVNISGGMSVENITDSNCWSKRPCFLWQDEENWPKRVCISRIESHLYQFGSSYYARYQQSV